MPIAKIDSRLCNGCGRCVDTCPEDVFRLNVQPVPGRLDSPCAKGCPAGISVRTYSYYVEMNMLDEAITELRRYNPFPAVTGRVCPHDCESHCARANVDDSVNINALERYVADQFLSAKASPAKKIYSSKVAVVGSGPAGLSCAYYLCQKGYPVTVFEKSQVLGGMLSTAIPSFRLPRGVVADQIRMLEEMGVEFRCGVEVGKDIGIEQLYEQGYGGIFLAVGLQNGGKLNILGETAKGVQSGIDYVRNLNLKKAADLNGDVVVIGGGKIGADVARIAMRGGARSVKLFCLEDAGSMPMGDDDRTLCEQEGVSIFAGWGQTEIWEENGLCTGITFKKCVSTRNGKGEFEPVFDESITTETACTDVLYCIGQRPDWGGLIAGTKVALTQQGLAEADAITLQTGDPRIFVGGDVYTGQKFCVDAIACGREGAESIDRYLRGVDLIQERRNRTRVEFPPKDDIPTFPRQNAGRDGEFTGNEARLEAQRCMTCGSRSEIIYPDDCMVCLYCQRDCPTHAITITPDRAAHHIEPWDLG